eukprot:2235549-Prymnesium_polylepis.2
MVRSAIHVCGRVARRVRGAALGVRAPAQPQRLHPNEHTRRPAPEQHESVRRRDTRKLGVVAGADQSGAPCCRPCDRQHPLGARAQREAYGAAMAGLSVRCAAGVQHHVVERWHGGGRARPIVLRAATALVEERLRRMASK